MLPEKGNQLLRCIISFQECPGGTYSLSWNKTNERFLFKKILFNPFRIPGAEYFTFLWLDKIKPAISLHVFIVYGSFLLFAAHFEFYNPDRLTFLLQKLLLFPGSMNEIRIHVFTMTDGRKSHPARQHFKLIPSKKKKKSLLIHVYICLHIFTYAISPPTHFEYDPLKCV